MYNLFSNICLTVGPRSGFKFLKTDVLETILNDCGYDMCQLFNDPTEQKNLRCKTYQVLQQTCTGLARELNITLNSDWRVQTECCTVALIKLQFLM